MKSNKWLKIAGVGIVVLFLFAPKFTVAMLMALIALALGANYYQKSKAGR